MIVVFNETATTEIYTLSLHDALPICEEALEPADRVGVEVVGRLVEQQGLGVGEEDPGELDAAALTTGQRPQRLEQHPRSEEHTTELQSRQYLVCRLLLAKKQTTTNAC